MSRSKPGSVTPIDSKNIKIKDNDLVGSNHLSDTPQQILSKKPLADWRGSLTTFDGLIGTLPAEEIENVGWSEIKQRICPEKPALIVDKKKGEYFVPCQLKEAPLVGNTLKMAESAGKAKTGKMRSKTHVTEANMLVMDIDGLSEDDYNAGLDKIKEDGLTYIAYTTFSHGNPKKPGKRARIVVPVDGALDIEDYRFAWHGFDQHYWDGEAGKADSSGANLYQQQGTWCCNSSHQDKASTWRNETGVAFADALIVLGKSFQAEKPNSEKQPVTSDEDRNSQEYPPSDVNKVADLCNQIGMFRKTKGADQVEPLWNDCLGVVGHCENGEELSQSWSSGHQGYSECETAKKLTNRMKYPPTTCDQFKKTHPEGCSACVKKCRSPITLGWPDKEGFVSIETNAGSKAVMQKTVDNASSTVNPKSNINQSAFDEVEPYPDAVNPAELFVLIVVLLKRHLVISEEQATALALWIAFTWFIDHVHIAPLLIINAPEKACGKTQALDLVARMSRLSLSVSNISTAALFRTCESLKPTLFIDEVDTFASNNQEIKGLINAGHSRSNAYVIRVVGDQHEPKQFSVWGAKALAGIFVEKHLPDSTMSRGVVINMRRKMPTEIVTRIRHADQNQFHEIKTKLARLAVDYGDQVSHARPELPDELSDRAQDNWEPLLAIAECAGPEWVQRATAAALKLSKSETSVSIANELLADIQYVFEKKKVEKISTVELITALANGDEMPWATYNRGNSISPRQLGGHLRKYGIKSKTVRVNYSTPKGYDLGQFQDVFDRYLASPENLPQRRNDSSETMPAIASGVSGTSPQPSITELPKETPRNSNNAATLEALLPLESGGVADDS